MKKLKPQARYSQARPWPALHRFFVPAADFAGERVVLSAQQAHQICRVLRLEPGGNIVTLDNQGVEYLTVLATVSPHEAKGRIVEKRPATGEPRVQITLYQSLLAREKFELVLQKCTEVGVSRFVPLITQRSVVRSRGTAKQDKLARWRRIITEAAEQSHRGRIPELTSPVDLEKSLDRLGDFDLTLIASPHTQADSLRDCLARCGAVESVALLIGPEGGFTTEEVEQAVSKQAMRFSMGPRILRTETAAVVASALILYELGEMNV